MAAEQEDKIGHFITWDINKGTMRFQWQIIMFKHGTNQAMVVAMVNAAEGTSSICYSYNDAGNWEKSL